MFTQEFKDKFRELDSQIQHSCDGLFMYVDDDFNYVICKQELMFGEPDYRYCYQYSQESFDDALEKMRVYLS